MSQQNGSSTLAKFVGINVNLGNCVTSFVNYVILTGRPNVGPFMQAIALLPLYDLCVSNSLINRCLA